MIRHVRVLTFVPTGPTRRSRPSRPAGAAAAPPPLWAVRYGRDLELNDANASFAIVADFDTLEEYFAYRDDPEHMRILTQVIRPILGRVRSAVQLPDA